MKKLLLLAFLLSSFMSSSAQSTLKSGSVITLRFVEEVKSNSNAANVVVANDVKVDDKIIVSAGTPVQTQVTATKRRSCGIAGVLNVAFISTRATDGTLITLIGGSISREGKNKRGLAIGLGVGLGVLAWPLLSCLVIRGGEAVIPEGTLTTNVLTANEVTIK
ncbi:hypothetical protein [uncultured Prevotellamassilia sp.]|uniref:hypothetical protein n=1 Tax=uncultured Prevotellamassilia sp. TaxID=1926676 RepID=UPI00258D0367|nr:hypothetical protein [uncultured Prevotellamassilia sp.]